MAKKVINPWKDLHKVLSNQPGKTSSTSLAVEKAQEIMVKCNYSITTFYRKMDNPQSISYSDACTISKVYGKKVTDLFPGIKIPA